MVEVVYAYLHFNSQPRKEADTIQGIIHIDQIISIHSLARRLTTYRRILCRITNISIHSLARRLTLSQPSGRFSILFQFTASQGG